MSKAGAEIIAALEDAVQGHFVRVTIRGQRWVRETPLHRAAPELLEALKNLHGACDDLLAMLVARDPTFMPSKSAAWPAVVAAHAAIAKAEGR